jgi:DNA-binding CsgD family transcriptional regulator
MLTKREKEVVEELVKGFSYKEISHSLNISPSTVNDHLKNIYHKMGVKSKSELIAKILTN